MGVSSSRFDGLGWGLLAAGIIVALYATIDRLDVGFPIRQVGHLLPTSEMSTWWAMWWVLGGAAVLALARALFRATEDPARAQQIVALWSAGSDRAWVAGCAIAAFSLSSAVCWGVLGGRHIVVDESAYLFMARVIATGRLYADSPPDPFWYDRGFMINDGKLYSQYFVGWPVMLAPFARLGLEQWANPVWFAATVPAVFAVLRRLVGSPWARLGALLFVTAPIAVFGAATQMAHIACAFWLAWAFWFGLRAASPDAPPWAAAGLALACSAAFFVRPTTATGIGGPIVVWWIASRFARADGKRLRDAVAFVVPAFVLGAAFLLVNRIQTGDPLQVGYTEYHEYTLVSPFLQDHGEDSPKALDMRQGWKALTGPFAALLRLNYALFGWPASLLFVPFAVSGPGGRLVLASFLGMLGVHLFVADPGIMAYGPVHYFEMVVPVVFLTVLGVREVTRIEVPAWAGRAVVTVLAASWLAAVAAYWPWRLQNLGRIGAATAIPYALVEGKGPSVVFTPHGRWLPHCVDEQVHAFHVSRPDNPPDLQAEVLWVNHVSVPHDRGFMARYYPDRRAFILDWNPRCEPRLLDLAVLGPDDYPAWFREKGLKRFDHLLRAP